MDIGRDGERGTRVALAAVIAALALATAACGGGGGDASGGASTVPATGGAALTTDTACRDWLAASADDRAAALESRADHTDGGINSHIHRTRAMLADTAEEAAAVPERVDVGEGVELVDVACALVAPDDTVAQAIPAYEFHSSQEGTTTS